MVLSTCCDDALKGALGVALGFGVRVGGTSEKGVSVKIGVHVGRGVVVGVISNVGLAVHVASSLIGSGVFVGVLAYLPVGGRIFMEEFGLMKITKKYPAAHTVNTSIAIERISQVSNDDCGFLI